LADPSLGSPLPNNAAYLDSASTAVSADGRYVAFYSYANNLVPGDVNSNYDVFVRDRQLARPRSSAAAFLDQETEAPSALRSVLTADTSPFIPTHQSGVRRIHGNYQVFVRDRQTGTTTLVSMGANGQGNNTSASPTISPNGRYVTFYSNSSNLTPEGGNGFYQTTCAISKRARPRS